MPDYDFPNEGYGVAVVTSAISTQVALLDDEAEELEKLRVELASFPGTTVHEATDYKGFRKLIESFQFDAASIDWELHGVEKGKEILGFLRKDYPEIARVVFTKHERRKKDAMLYGADVCLIKRLDDDLNEYHDVMERAVRLGLARRIVKQLRQLGHSDLTDPPAGALLDEESEIVIFETAIQTASARRLEGREDTDLRALLLRRGWWREIDFNGSSYARSAKHQKVRLLAEYVNASLDELATIFGVSPQAFETMLQEGNSAEFADRTLMDAFDRLLSVMGYVLRLSGYDPEVMPYLWRAHDLYDRRLEKPPWDELGLGKYLDTHGLRGIYESLIWIRGH